MTKGTSEGKVRLALNQIGGLEIYKPPDDARNWKPCDFMVWWNATPGEERRWLVPRSAWIEVKENKQLGSFPLAEMRPPQRLGIAGAFAIGLPYLLVIWWTRRRIWTISDGLALRTLPAKGSMPFSVLAGRIGIDAQQDHLAEVLRACLMEGLLDGKAEA